MKHHLLHTMACLALLISTACADIYIRNKAVPSKPHQPTVYVSNESLAKYFTAEELERCEIDPSTGEIRVDGNLLAERLGTDPESNVPIVALAEALGFQRRVNNTLGIVDYVSSDTLEGKRPQADAAKRKGPEYSAAGLRMSQVLKKTPQLTNHPELERVKRMGQEIADVSDMPGLQWNFLIVSDSSPNAFCTGVGWVAITDGLLDLKLSDDELAGVLAHEVGHGCRRDIEEQGYNLATADSLKNQVIRLKAEWDELTRRQAELYERAGIAQDLARQYSHPDNIREARQEAAQASREAEALSRPIRNLEREIKLKAESWSDHKDFATASEFQHQDEIEADQKGLRYATQAGYSADGLMSALQKLAGKNARTFGQAAYQGGQSHPPLAKRIETMRKVLAAWRNR